MLAARVSGFVLSERAAHAVLIDPLSWKIPQATEELNCKDFQEHLVLEQLPTNHSNVRRIQACLMTWLNWLKVGFFSPSQIAKCREGKHLFCLKLSFLFPLCFTPVFSVMLVQALCSYRYQADLSLYIA